MTTKCLKLYAVHAQIKMVPKLLFIYSLLFKYCGSSGLKLQKIDDICSKETFCKKRRVQELQVAVTITAIERSDIWCSQERGYA